MTSSGFVLLPPDTGHHPAPDLASYGVGAHDSAQDTRLRKQKLGLSRDRQIPSFFC